MSKIFSHNGAAVVVRQNSAERSTIVIEWMSEEKQKKKQTSEPSWSFLVRPDEFFKFTSKNTRIEKRIEKYIHIARIIGDLASEGFIFKQETCVTNVASPNGTTLASIWTYECSKQQFNSAVKKLEKVYKECYKQEFISDFEVFVARLEAKSEEIQKELVYSEIVKFPKLSVEQAVSISHKALDGKVGVDRARIIKQMVAKTEA